MESRVNITEITDMNLVCQAFNSPNNRPWASEDGRKVCIPYMPEKILYMGISVEGHFAGCVLGIRQTTDRLDLHIAYLPICFGHTVQIGKQVLKWIRGHYPTYHTYQARVAQQNHMAREYVLKCGFRLIRLRPDGWIGGIAEYESEVSDG